MMLVDWWVSGIELERSLSKFVSWCFKPSQPQRITSGLCLSKRQLKVINEEKEKDLSYLSSVTYVVYVIYL